MTHDLDAFQQLLKNLASLTHLEFQVWDSQDMLFSSNGNGTGGGEKPACRDFSASVMSETKPLRNTNAGQGDLIGAPLTHGSQVVGSLIARERSGADGPLPAGAAEAKNRDPEAVASLVQTMASVMEEMWSCQQDTDQMAEELSNAFENLSLHTRIASHLRSIKSSEASVAKLVEELPEALGVDMAFVEMPNRPAYSSFEFSPEGRDKIPSHKGFAQALINAISPDTPTLEAGYCIINNSQGSPHFVALHPAPFRFLAVKVQHEDHFDGWLGMVAFNLDQIFRQSELRLLESMAKQVSVLLSNMDLYLELEQFVINVVKSLVYAIEAKDIYTRGHSERVNRYAMLIADRLNLEKSEKDALNWASILHDIGKIAVPESVLNKPSQLDDQEFDIIKGHPDKGFNILKPLGQLSNALPGILYHHERYDGKGYPTGLKGDAIPLAARIISVADTFDAMTSNRAYRTAKKACSALEIINEIAGSQLDPQLVSVFKDVFETTLKEEF